jgi:hypothetical protein
MSFPRLAFIPFLFFIQTLGSPAMAAFKASLAVEGVTHSKVNVIDSSESGYQSCSSFKGTISNNTVWIFPSATGGSGKYSFSIHWRFNSGYRDYGVEAQFEESVRPGRSVGIRIPELRDDVPYLQQGVMLIARDRETGEAAHSEVLFTVSRNVILSPSSDPKVQDQNCFERYPAVESMIGVLTNGSTNISNLTIKQGIDRLFGSSSGLSWGFFISPLSLVPVYGATLGSLFSLNRNYFSMVSRQTSETVEVSTGYQLSPGDAVQIHTQKTRYISHYDATTVDACGNRKLFSGAYPLQWWGFAYHAVPVHPLDPARPDPASIGARPMNTCPARLSEVSGSPETQFLPTNF